MHSDEIKKGLEQNAQIIQQRLPENVTDAEAREIAESLTGFMARHGLSRNKVAKALGCSPTTISKFLAGTYEGNLQGLTNKIVNYINAIARRDEKRRPFVHTTIAKKIGALITQAEAFSTEEGKIAIIIGDSGHGKSCCLKQYSEANKNTIYIQLDQAMRSSLIFSEIAREIGVESFGWLSKISRSVVRKLQARHVIVIIDEASSLTVPQLDLLRQTIAVKAHCPLILAGNNDLLKTVMQPTVKKGYSALDQFRSRLMAILNLDELADIEDDGLYSAADIRRLYEYGGIRLLNNAVSTLKRICMTPGTGRLRTCSHIITALHTSNVIRGKGYIDSSLIIAVIEQLDLPVRAFLPLAIMDSSASENAEQTLVKAG
ncbi:MAG: AAA family ATPase [Sedimentisphaerales bacterium]